MKHKERNRETEGERTKEERGVGADAWETLEKGMEVRKEDTKEEMGEVKEDGGKR